MANKVKELWAKYAKTKNSAILVQIGEINRAIQVQQSNVKMEAGSEGLSLCNWGYSWAVESVKVDKQKNISIKEKRRRKR